MWQVVAGFVTGARGIDLLLVRGGGAANRLTMSYKLAIHFLTLSLCQGTRDLSGGVAAAVPICKTESRCSDAEFFNFASVPPKKHLNPRKVSRTPFA